MKVAYLTMPYKNTGCKSGAKSNTTPTRPPAGTADNPSSAATPVTTKRQYAGSPVFLACLVLKMPLAGQDQRGIHLIDQLDRLVVLHRPAGVNNCRHTRLQQKLWRIGERKKRVRRRHRATDAAARLAECQPGGRGAVHLPRASPQQHTILCNGNRVALDMFAHQPREFQVLHFIGCRLTA